MAFVFRLGNADFSSYVATDGFKWERNDVDASNSGRDMEGRMHRKVVSRKDKMTITCRPLKPAELSTLMTELSKDTIYVTYTVPGIGLRNSAQFYNSKKSAGIVQDLGSVITYNGVSFDLIEV